MERYLFSRDVKNDKLIYDNIRVKFGKLYLKRFMCGV